MAGQSHHNENSWLCHLPGWMLLVAGIVLLAAAVLTPAWVQTRNMQHQQAVMQSQVDLLLKQQHSYEQFHEALLTDDPVLLKRLAYYYLRLKPEGAQHVASEDTSSDWLGMWQMPVVEELLHQPLPELQVNLAHLQPDRTRLGRLTSGHNRWIVLLASVLCICAGLIRPRRTA